MAATLDEPRSSATGNRKRHPRSIFGILLIVIGLLLLVHQLFPDLSSILFWPLILIAIGAWLLWRARPS
jgi:hypothetical protein